MSSADVTNKGTKESLASAGLSFHEQEAMVAVATAPGPAAIAILRASGHGCHALAQALIRGPRYEALVYRTMSLCQVVDPETSEVLDESMVAFFRGPHSYTGQDAIEVFCHGGPYVVRRIYALFLAHGFRPAEPGEFTRRAFLNGKLDLTQAEGIRELVEAGSHQQWVAARHLATGTLAGHIDGIRADLVHAMAYLEALIDFPDEGDTKSAELQTVRAKAEAVAKSLERLVATYDNGRVATQGMRVAIFGPPNAGKSTLMNTVLRKERAIVTDIAGTTRDYLEERCLIKGRLISLVDTAGVRQTDELVEKMGVAASLTIAEEADLVLALVNQDMPEAERQAFTVHVARLPNDKVIKVLSKCDAPGVGVPGYLSLSCHTHRGVEALEEAIAAKVDNYVAKLNEGVFITSERHRHAVHASLAALARFFQAMDEGQYEECLAFELQDAARALAGLVGKIDNEDVLDKIFSDFCVGK